MLRNKTKLSDEEAQQLVDELMEQSSSEVREALVAHLSKWALDGNKSGEINKVAGELQAVLHSFFVDKGTDGRVALLALDFVMEQSALSFAKQHGEVSIQQEAPPATSPTDLPV